MTTVERTLPSGNNMCLSFLLGKREMNLESYSAACSEFENKIEESLKTTLSRLDIAATTKTDRLSLPYNESVKITLNGSSFMNDAFNISRFARQVVVKLLGKSVFQLRFYVFIEVVEGSMGFGSIVYHFRYHLRN